MDRESALGFAWEWIFAVNSHDVDKILKLYSHDCVLESPVIVGRFGVEEGTLKGKLHLRQYWEMAMEVRPYIYFRLIDVFVGVNSIVVYYENLGRKMTLESFQFDEKGRICRSSSLHGEPLSDVPCLYYVNREQSSMR